MRLWAFSSDDMKKNWMDQHKANHTQIKKIAWLKSLLLNGELLGHEWIAPFKQKWCKRTGDPQQCLSLADSHSPPAVTFLPVTQQVSSLELLKQISSSPVLLVKRCPSGPFTACSFLLKVASRKGRNGSRKSVVFQVNLGNLQYQPRQNSVVSRGKPAKKRNVWHKNTFDSSVPQQKAWKLLRHCCLTHCTLLALQEMWSLITKRFKISWSKSYTTYETVSFWLK